MKRFFLLSFITTFLFLTIGCSSDDNSPSINGESILGKWKAMTLDTKVLKDNAVVEEQKDYPAHEHAIITVNFKQNNVMEYYFKNLDDANADEINQTGTYSINGTTLSFNLNELGENSVQILLLNNTTLKVQLKPEPFEKEGIQYTRINTLTLTKM